jgi:hypothetical protein
VSGITGLQAMKNHVQNKVVESPEATPDEAPSTLTSDHVSHNWHNLDNRLSLIAEAAYFLAEKRGFEPGHEEADWLQAEQELAEIMGVA